jgi:hypothetical protein
MDLCLASLINQSIVRTDYSLDEGACFLFILFQSVHKRWLAKRCSIGLEKDLLLHSECLQKKSQNADYFVRQISLTFCIDGAIS